MDPARPTDRASNAPEVEVLIVTSTACHLCERAKDILTRLTTEYRLRWREVDITSPEGSGIARESRAPFPPVIVVEGSIYGHGRLSEKKLRKDLDRMTKKDLNRLTKEV